MDHPAKPYPGFANPQVARFAVAPVAMICVDMEPVAPTSFLSKDTAFGLPEKLARIAALPLDTVAVVAAAPGSPKETVPFVAIHPANRYPAAGVAEIAKGTPWFTVWVPAGVAVPLPSVWMVNLYVTTLAIGSSHETSAARTARAIAPEVRMPRIRSENRARLMMSPCSPTAAASGIASFHPCGPRR